MLLSSVSGVSGMYSSVTCTIRVWTAPNAAAGQLKPQALQPQSIHSMASTEWQLELKPLNVWVHTLYESGGRLRPGHFGRSLYLM